MLGIPFGTIAPGASALAPVIVIAPRLARPAVRSGKRAEDTAAGCRANAAADLGRADAPGGDYMRARLEHSASVWIERANLLERLETKFKSRMAAA